MVDFLNRDGSPLKAFNLNDHIRRRRFQLSIRGLLIAAPLVALFIVVIFNIFLTRQKSSFDSAQQNFPDVSPFSGIRWENGVPFVQVVGYEGEWYQLLAVNEISIDKMTSFCNFRKWDVRKRLNQDVVQLVHLMGGELQGTATLRLRNAFGHDLALQDVCMTQDARKSCVHPFDSGAPGYPSWSPFVDAKWVNDDFFVRIPEDPIWYELISIHGRQLESMLAICEENGWDSKRRTKEDMIQLLRLMGHNIEKTTSLTLRRSNGEMSVLEDVGMSEENLDQVLGSQME